jgi:hypothetical protein
MAVDYIINGKPKGELAERLVGNGMDPGYLRPWNDPETGKAYVTVRDSRSPNGYVDEEITHNASTLRPSEYEYFDRTIEDIATPNMVAFNDLRRRGLVFNLPNAMGKTVIKSMVRGRTTPATISMDPKRRSERDRIQWDTRLFPIPVVHKDYSFTIRELAAARNDGEGLDTMVLEDGAERCAEEVEKLTLGVSASYSYGGGTIYGYGNHPSRVTKTLTAPGSWGAGGAKVLLTELVDARQSLRDRGFSGPFAIYSSQGWDEYSDAKGDNSVADRIGNIRGFGGGFQSADYLGTGLRILIVEMRSRTVRAVVGMDLQTIVWETDPMAVFMKVYGILLPQLRADINNYTGIADCAVP